MGRLEDLKVLYTSAPVDNRAKLFENIFPPCRILNLLTIQDIMQLNQIANDKKLNTRPKEKLEMIKSIMGARGFKRLSSGTNRICFKYMEDQSFVIKVAYDHVGLSDNLHELYNQEFLKPFCTKVFEVSPCGTVGMFERVRAIKNREEFQNIANDVFDIIVNEFVGKYILADIGNKFFMNWGIREGMFPVILDFPYVYELDGARIYCNRPDPTSPYGFCGGEIDYDEGFNHLVCTKCGKTFLASELKLAAEKKSSELIIEQEDNEMIIEITNRKGVTNVIGEEQETSTYKRRKETPLEYRQRRKFQGLKIEIEKRDEEEVNDEVETVSEKVTAHQEDPDPESFNHGWGSKDIPSIDKMFKDMQVEIKKRPVNKPTPVEKDIKEDVLDKEQEEIILDENNTDNDEYMIEKFHQPDPLEEDNTVDKNDPYGMAKSILEIITEEDQVPDDEDPDDVTEEY